MRIRTLGLSVGLHALVVAAAFIPMPSARDSCEAAKDRMKGQDPSMTERQLAEALPECAKYIRIPTEWIEIGLTDNLLNLPKPITPPEADEKPDPTPPESEADTPPLAEAAAVIEADTEEADDTAPVESTTSGQPKPTAPQEEDIIIPEDTEKAAEADTKTADPEPEPEPDITPPAEDTPPPKPADKVLNKTAPTSDEDDFFSTLDDIDDMLDEQAPTRPAQTPQAVTPQATIKNSQTRPQLRQRGAGKRTGNEIALQTAIRQKILACWNGVDGLPNPERLDVVVQLNILKSGYLQTDPVRIKPSAWPVGDRPMLTAIERALRAARKCEPYDNLPLDYYDSWKKINVTIGTSK